MDNVSAFKRSNTRSGAEWDRSKCSKKFFNASSITSPWLKSFSSQSANSLAFVLGIIATLILAFFAMFFFTSKPLYHKIFLMGSASIFFFDTLVAGSKKFCYTDAGGTFLWRNQYLLLCIKRY